jgi:hypothetical protein
MIAPSCASSSSNSNAPSVVPPGVNGRLEVTLGNARVAFAGGEALK